MVSLAKAAAEFEAYTKRRDNPHRVTAEQLGVYSKSEITIAEITKNLANFAQIPISQYGTPGWQNLHFNGNFEGNTIDANGMPGVVIWETGEQYSALVNGTDGLHWGVYVTTIRLNGSAILEYNQSTVLYQPTILESGESVMELYNSNGRTAIWGSVRTSSTQYDSFVALTHGTGNPESHTAAFFKMPTEFAHKDRFIIANTKYIYAFIPTDGYPGASVWRVNQVDLHTKKIITWTRVANLTTVGLRNKVLAENTLKFAKAWTGTSAATDPLLMARTLRTPEYTPVRDIKLFSGSTGADDIFYLSLNIGGPHWYEGSRYTDDNVIHFTFDTTTNTATMPEADRGNRQFDLMATDNGGYMTTWIGGKQMNPYGVFASTDFASRRYVALPFNPSAYAVLFGYDQKGLPTLRTAKRGGTFGGDGQQQYFIDYNATLTTDPDDYRLVGGKVSGVIGRNICNPHWLSIYTLAALSIGDPGDAIDTPRFIDCFGVTELDNLKELEFNYDYVSERYGTTQGISPEPWIDRYSKFLGYHSEFHYVGGGSPRSVSVAQGRLTDSINVTATNFRLVPGLIFEYGGTLAYTQSNWENLRSAVAAEFRKRYNKTWPDSQVRIELQVPTAGPQNGLSICFGQVIDNNTVYVGAFLAKPEARSTNIGQVTLLDVIGFMTYGGNTYYERPVQLTSPTIYFINRDENLLVTVCAQSATVTANNSPAMYVVLEFDTTTGAHVRTLRMDLYYMQYNRGVPYCPMPGKGLGEIDFARNTEANGCILYWRQIGTTRDQLRSLKASETRNVLLAQYVVKELIAYITEPIPLIMLGRMWTLPATAFNLPRLKPDPYNTTFYIYVEVVNNAARYQVYFTPQTETLTCCYVGEIVTDSKDIVKLLLSKVTRIGVWRISTTQIGSGIPATTGIATDTVQLDWKTT